MMTSRTHRSILRFIIVFSLSAVGVTFAATDWDPATLMTQPFDVTTNLLRMTPGPRWGLFRQSDSISIQTADGSPIQIFDLDGNSIYAGNPTTLSLPLGHYFVEANGDRTQFAVLPNDYAGAPFLGTEADNGQDSQTTERLAGIAPTWVRAFEAMWTTVQTNRDTWDWSAMDKVITANVGRKIIASTAYIIPSWVGPDEVIARHTEFARALAKRYAGKLAAIEIWNEPWINKFPTTTNFDDFANFYVQLFAQARQAIKAVDPSVKVIGPAWSSFEYSACLETNKLSRFDGWSWHDYARGTYPPDVNYAAPIWIPACTKDNLAHFFGRFMDLKLTFADELGLYGHSALGADTNASAPADSDLDWYRGMCRGVKTTVMYRAAGLACILPHVMELSSQLDNPDYEIFGWDVGLRGPHPKTSAFLMTCYWLNGAKVGDIRLVNNQVYLYTWTRPKTGTFTIAWCLEGQAQSITVPPGYTMTDIYGRAVHPSMLGEEPVIFRPAKSTSARRAADAVQAAVGG